MDPVRLTVFHELFGSVAEEMGAVLCGTAPSVNIRERRDYSCAVFDADARLVSQAAHIPVHLGSAALSVAAVRRRFADLEPGDAVLLNDPYEGGTHLPDLTLVTPVFTDAGAPWFVASRAHHADVGGSRPGSMSPEADLPAEGLRIPPVRLLRGDEWVDDVRQMVLANTRTPVERAGDLQAQVQANRLGVRRLVGLNDRFGHAVCVEATQALYAYAARRMALHLRALALGRYEVADVLEGDGLAAGELTVALTLTVGRASCLTFDFSASSDQCGGSMNANPAVTLAAVLYSLCCLAPSGVPVNAGLLEGVDVRTRRGSILEPIFPGAVAGGNVETSQRLVDVCLAALGAAGAEVPAQSSGTMNNLSIGGVAADDTAFAAYETIGGGAGASAQGPGGSGVQTHMTNTRNTPVEEIELTQPILVERYTLRRGSGGRGEHAGGDGIIKEFTPLVPLRGSLLSERRRVGPRGAAGGANGKPGQQRRGGRALPGKGTFELRAGETFRVETPGGGGWG
ncbi:MAG: 5-oxoprolinase [Planctomycetes bacterium]|jgi:N-methylhydantoinase B|nr:5-oxoprolinase [Planctomycetota bacterium]MDP6424824.1 hydantoinase B/oxoprolinase family protein [Planctomycetota bacterium]